MSIVAKRYAEALFELARERGQLDSVQEEIELVAASIRDHSEFAEVLNHPRISAAQKKEVLMNVLGSHLSEINQNFLQLLIDKGRQNLLPHIVEAYIELANESRGVAVGTAITATPLTDTERTRLEATFTAKVDKKVQLDNVVDPQVKGGVLVRLADRIYDGSVSGKLARFQRRLKATQL